MQGRGSLVVLAAFAFGCKAEADAESSKSEAAAPSPVQAALAVPRPDDLGPARLGDPASSRAAAPSFAMGYAPLLVGPVAQQLWSTTDATPSAAPIDRDLLLCRIDTAPDHEVAGVGWVRVRWGDAHELDGSARGSARTRYVGIPLVSLASGEPIELTVPADGGPQHLEATFAGRPLRLAGDAVGVECRVVPAPARDEAVRDALWKADKKLASLAATSIDDLGEGADLDAAIERVERTLEDAAALVGWDDPRVQRRRTRAREVAAGAAREVAAERADDPAVAPGAWMRFGPQLSARVDDMTCTFAEPAADTDGAWMHAHDPAYTCIVTLTIQHGEHEAIELMGHYGGSMRFGATTLRALDAVGRACDLGLEGDPVTLAADSAGIVRLRIEPEWGARDDEGLRTTIPTRLEWTRGRKVRLGRGLVPGPRPRRSDLPRPAACTGAAPHAACG